MKWCPYSELGVPRDATEKQIKAAYRKRSKSAHPDAGGHEEWFQRTVTAYELLMDAERRAHYDATGEVLAQQAENGHAVALQKLAQIFDQAIQNAINTGRDPKDVPLVDHMRQRLEAEIGDREKTRRDNETAIERWSALQDRFSVKDETRANVMADIIKSRIVILERNNVQIDRDDNIARAVLAILDNHEFRADAPPTPTFTFHQVGTSSTSTGAFS